MMNEPIVDLETAAASLGISPSVLTLALAHITRSDDFPFLSFPTSRRPIVIFLDQLHWIALAKARLGRPDTMDDAQAYEYLVTLASQDQAIFPIAAASYMEIARIGSCRQRIDLADTIGMVGGFVTIGSATLALDVQLKNALAARFGGEKVNVTWPFGIGVGFAFGIRGGMRIGVEGEEHLTPRAGPLSPDEARLTALAEYMMLRGPSSEEIPDLRLNGYRPEALAQVESDRVKHEQYLKDRLVGRSDLKGKLGDIVAARHLYWELRDVLPRYLALYDLTVDEFLSYGKEWLIEFLMDVPSAAVNIALREQNFKNAYKGWTGNDIRDFDAMSEAVPYCDIVLTDKHVREQLRKSGVPAQLGTLVISRLSELNNVLIRLGLVT